MRVRIVRSALVAGLLPLACAFSGVSALGGMTGAAWAAGSAAEDDLPVPPIPPASPPPYLAAPLPGQSPDAAASGASGPRFRPSVFARASASTDGYLRGSTAEDQQDDRRTPAAGLKLSLPLRQ